jgi:Na+/H+ antiporter NhaC
MRYTIIKSVLFQKPRFIIIIIIILFFILFFFFLFQSFDHQKENIEVYTFELEEEDLTKINELNQNKRVADVKNFFRFPIFA